MPAINIWSNDRRFHAPPSRTPIGTLVLILIREVIWAVEQANHTRKLNASMKKQLRLLRSPRLVAMVVPYARHVWEIIPRPPMWPQRGQITCGLRTLSEWCCETLHGLVEICCIWMSPVSATLQTELCLRMYWSYVSPFSVSAMTRGWGGICNIDILWIDVTHTYNLPRGATNWGSHTGKSFDSYPTEAEKKATILQKVFPTSFLDRTYSCLIENSPKFVPMDSIDNASSWIEVMINRQPAITWSNFDQSFWHRMASLAHNELMTALLFIDCSTYLRLYN